MEKSDLSTVDHGWTDAPPTEARITARSGEDPLPGDAVAPHPPPKGLTALLGTDGASVAPPPVTVSAFPAPEELPSAPLAGAIPAVSDPPESLDDDAIPPSEESKQSDVADPKTDTAKRRIPARNAEERDDTAPRPPKPEPAPPPPPEQRRTLPPPAGYDDIRRTAGRIAYVLEQAPPKANESARSTPVLVQLPRHEQSPSSPSLDVSSNEYTPSPRSEFAPGFKHARWTTALAVVLVLIGVSAAGAAGVLSLREPSAAPSVATAAPPTTTETPANAEPAPASAPPPETPEETVAAVAAPARSSPPTASPPPSSTPSPRAVPTSSPTSARPLASAARPAPSAASAASARSAAPSAAPPGLQFLKRNL